MPFINVKSYSINKDKSVLGGRGAKNTSLIVESATPEANNVYEVIFEYPCAEVVVMGMVGHIIDGTIYKASNLKANNKPAHGIILDDGNTIGDKVRIQVAGICSSVMTLTANKDVYLRHTSPYYSQTPLITPTVNEDGYQKIGRAVNTNVLLIDIRPFQQIT